MAEIKKFETGGFYNKPIGVVRPSDAGVRFAQQIERAGATLANFAYERAVEEQTEAGKKAALRMRTRDENGKLIYQDVSDELSPIAQKQAESVYNQAYLTSLGNDMKNQMQALYDQHQLDPDGFDAQADILREKTKELVPEDFQVFADEIGMSLQSEYYNTAATNAKKAFNEQVANNAVTAFDRVADDVYQMSTNETLTIMESGVENWGNIATTAIQSIEDFKAGVDVFASTNSLTTESAAKLKNIKNRYEMNVAGGVFQAVLQYADNIEVTDTTFKSQQQLKTDIANAATATVRDGAIPKDVNPIARKVIEKFGLVEVVQGMRRENRRNLASDLTTSTNAMEERIADEIAIARLTTTETNASTAPKKDFDSWMTANGLDAPMDVLRYIDANKGKSDNPLNRRLFGSTAPLPSAVTNIFNNRSTLLSMVNENYAVVRSLYDTMTLPDAGGQKVFMGRGLNEDAIMLMTTLKTIEELQIPGGVKGYSAKASDPTSRLEEVGKQILADNNKKVEDIVNDVIDDDAPTARVKAKEVLPHLVGHLGYDNAIAALERYNEKQTSSDLLYDNEKSMMTPEAVYGEDLDTWLTEANKKLAIAGDWTIGDNAKLVRRKNTKDTEWLAVDVSTGFPIHFQGQEIILNDRALNAIRAAQAEVDTMNAQKEAIAENEQARKENIQRAKDEEFAEGLDEISKGEDPTFFSDLMRDLGFGQPVTESVPSETE